MKLSFCLFFYLVIVFYPLSTVQAQNVPAYVPTNGLVGWWPFNGNANDESGNGNHGVLYGAMSGPDRFGNPNGSYIFKGSSDYIQLGSAFFGGTQVPSFTIHTSFKVNIFTNSQGYGQNIWGKVFFWGEVNVEVLQDSSIRLFFANSFSGNKYSTAKTPAGSIKTNTWTTVDIVFQNSIATIYLNGQPVTTLLLWYSQSGATLSTTQIESVCNFATVANSSRFGMRSVGGVWGSYLNGAIDEFAIWNRALSLAEVQTLYTSQTIIPDVNNNSSLTYNFPSGISYQAIARDSSGQPYANASLNVRFTLRDSSLNGPAAYSETHALNTGPLGLFSTVIGTGTSLSGNYSSLQWMGPPKFLSVEIDVGNGFQLIGNQQLVSVPYANAADRAARIKNANLPVHNDNGSAISGGLEPGDMYRTPGGVMMIVY